MEQQTEYPVQKDDVIESAQCLSVGEKGDGMFKVKGLVVFVPGAKQGETYTIKITNVRPKVAFGEIVA